MRITSAGPGQAYRFPTGSGAGAGQRSVTHSTPSGDPRGSAVERDILMKRTTWILGSMTAFVLAACGGGAPGGDAGTAGGAGTETGSPGMTSDTAAAPGAVDTGMAADTASAGMDTATDTAAPK